VLLSTLCRSALVVTTALAIAFAGTSPTRAGETTRVTPMSQKLSNKLSPQAKKAVMLGSDQLVVALVQMAPAADRVGTVHSLQALQAVLRSWSNATGIATVELRADKLDRLADLEGVVYIEIGERYQP
jgi:hypothetical protein